MKKIIALIVVCIMMFSFTGCEKKDDGNTLDIFYLNIDATATVPEKYELKGTDESVDKQVDELLDKLSSKPDDSKLRKTIPDDVEIKKHEENAYSCTIDFSKSYYDMTAAEEVLMRASVVRTLTQLKQITYVMFTVDKAPLMNSDGEVIGSMNADDFVENPGEQINSSVKETLTLFFADKEGTGLKEQTRVIHYSSNISLEKLVVEQLIEGPRGSKLQATLPNTTKLINISVSDGICYLNFDSSFRNTIDNKLTEDVVLHSLVNSRTSLPSVDKVQISVDGENDGTLLYNYKLNNMYEFNKDIVDEEESTE